MFDRRLFLYTIAIILFVNVLSFLSAYSPILSYLSFACIIIITLLIANHRLIYGVYILLIELMISSQGHLFDIFLSGFRFSLRMGLFMTLIGVWFLKHRPPHRKEIARKGRLYIIFSIPILWGIVVGIANGNNANFLFQDVNGYLFFALLPVYLSAFSEEMTQKNAARQLLTIFAVGVVWQASVSLLLLFLYGHLDVFWKILIPFYDWFRDQRIIEVGLYRYNFYRVFMQSNIWVVYALFIFLSLWLAQKKKEKGSNDISIHALIILSLVTLIISLSRSFWIGIIGALLPFSIAYLLTQKPTIRAIFRNSITFALFTVASIALIALSISLPIGQIPGLQALAAIPKRAIESKEPALSSRFELLPEILKGIRKNVLIGSGFGATVTYRTYDPRYLAAHPNNPFYTTFAFEWGWLDIWYKIGLLGLLTYLVLIGRLLTWGVRIITEKGIADDTSPIAYSINFGLTFGLVALLGIHMFTPMLNHPLGIGYLLLFHAVIRSRTHFHG